MTNYQFANMIHSLIVNETFVAPWLLVEDESYVSMLADMVNQGLALENIKDALIAYVSDNY